MSNYDTFTDDELVDLLKLSDHNAFTALFNRYKSLLFRFTYRKMKDKDLAQDLLQSIFTDLWYKRNELLIRTSLAAYLFTVIKSRIFDHYRSKQVSERYIEQLQAYINFSENQTDYLVRQHDLDALIEKEITALPYHMRIVFNLSRNTNMSRKQIAEKLNLPEETVKSRMHRALKILKDKLGHLVVFI